MATLSDDERIRRFVLRARRVAAHSIMQDLDVVRAFAQTKFRGYLDLAGRMQLRLELPDNEEVFESLAARLRPLTVKSEPVHYAAVLDAIDRGIATAEVSDEVRDRLIQIRDEWASSELQGSTIRGYAMQLARADGSDATNMVSDTQLAAAWMYADLVHADATGPKSEALAFSLRDRYMAGVRHFSHLALLTVATLRVVEKLNKDGALTVESSAWDDEVVVGAGPIEEEARVFVAPVGTPAPDMRGSLEFGSDWTAFTVTELLRQDPTNQVQVVLTGADGSTIASYDAAVAGRPREAASLGWEILVAGCTLFKFAFNTDGEQITGTRFVGSETQELTNELKLAAIRFRLDLHRAAMLAFWVHGQPFVSLTPPKLDDASVQQLEVIAQTVDDIVAIECLTGERLDLCASSFDNRDRVWLRRTRLMREGKVVHGPRLPIKVTSSSGQPPQVVETTDDDLSRRGSSADAEGPPLASRHDDPGRRGDPGIRQRDPGLHDRATEWRAIPSMGARARHRDGGRADGDRIMESARYRRVDLPVLVEPDASAAQIGNCRGAVCPTGTCPVAFGPPGPQHTMRPAYCRFVRCQDSRRIVPPPRRSTFARSLPAVRAASGIVTILPPLRRTVSGELAAGTDGVAVQVA